MRGTHKASSGAQRCDQSALPRLKKYRMAAGYLLGVMKRVVLSLSVIFDFIDYAAAVSSKNTAMERVQPAPPNTFRCFFKLLTCWPI